jgi:hypothetical protein
MARHEGGCLCGEVRFVADVEPMRVTVCHCRFCQRTTGSAYMVQPVFSEKDFHITAGTPKTYDVISAGSGKRVTIHFCGTCGARVMLSFERFPGGMGAFAGSFDDPGKLGLAARNVRHVFTDVAQDGTVLPAGVPLFHGHAIRLDGSPNEPKVLGEPVDPSRGAF